MATSRTAIANMALSLIGSEQIQSFDQPEDKIERIINTFFEETYEEVCTEFPWNFCTRVAQLAETQSTPVDSYSNSFSIPNAPKCLRVIGLENVGNADPKWERRGDELLVNSSECYIKYIYKVDDIRKVPAHIVRCISTLLASKIAVPIEGVEGSQLASYYQDQYDRIVKPNALYLDVNEGKDPVIEESNVMGGTWVDGVFVPSGSQYNVFLDAPEQSNIY